MATDTIYGLVGHALNQNAVERIYALKRRRPDKPFIILIAEYADLDLFAVELSPRMRARLEEFWPGPVSVILPCPHQHLEYLHRGTQTLAFRMPAKEGLRSLIAQAGPLAAPSANHEGRPPARNIDEARGYFGDSAGFYLEGETTNRPSRLIQIMGDEIRVLRA